jgi:large subunit ribosomal protein L40e
MKGCYHQRDRDRESLDHSKNPVGTFKTSREIQIFVKSWSTTGRIIAINIQPTATIRQLKERIFYKEDIPPEQQRLIYAGKPLPDDGLSGETLQDYGIGQESTLRLFRTTNSPETYF